MVKRRIVRGLLGMGVAGIIALASLAGSVSAKEPPPFLPIHHKYLDLPSGVQPWLPVWTADGKHIVFRNQSDQRIWTTSKSGQGTQCITCGFADQPSVIGGGGFTYPFPDGKRLFIASKELGAAGGSDNPASADAYVLECAPSILNCSTHQYVPVDMSADKGSTFIVQRRTWHLAPDGVHLGWMDVRLDGTVMVVAKLEREANSYVATDARAVNPPGPTGPNDHSADRWENASQLYELKSFADGGRSILAVGERSSNTDVLKIDLRTGKTTRLTGNLDWDEDGAEASDGKSQVVESWRTRKRVEATAWIPQLRDFTGLQLGAALAPYYVSNWEGFQCDLSPWLLPEGGDVNGKLTGQPLDTYSGNRTAANNLTGLSFWSPDSTSVLLQEKLRTPPAADANPDVKQKGYTPNRVAIAQIDRPATKPDRVVSSTVGSWAPDAATFQGTMSGNRTAVVNGENGGSATIVYTGSIANGSVAVTYDGYTDDGKTFIDGTMSAGSPDGSHWSIDAAITASGAHTGALNANLDVNNGATPLPTKSGTFTATYDGKTAPLLPDVGPCYSQLPHRDKLRVETQSERTSKRESRHKVTVKVRANISSDKRAVRHALVKVGDAKARTNSAGKATLVLSGHGKRKVVVSAGDTFTEARRSVRLR